MKHFTKKQAWIRIAVAFETPLPKRNELSVKLAGWGLCHAIQVLGKYEKRISEKTAIRMSRQLQAWMDMHHLSNTGYI